MKRIKPGVIGIFIILWCCSGDLAAQESQNANVVLLNKEDIRSYQATTIVELLNMIPGVNTTESGTISMGGFSASDIIVTLDGRPINDQTKSTKYVNWNEVDFSSLIRLEIHKISSRCSGGEIKLFSKRKGDIAKGRLKAWRGLNDHNGIEGSVNQGMGDVFFNLAHTYSTEGEHHHNNNDSEETATSFKAALERDYSLNLTLSHSKDEHGQSIFSYDTPEGTRPASSDDYYPDLSKPRYRETRESVGAVVNAGRGSVSSEWFVNAHEKVNHATGVKKDDEGNIIYEVDDEGNVSTIPHLAGNEVNVLEYGGKIGVSQNGYEYGLRSVFTSGDFSKTSSQGTVTKGDAEEYLADLFGGFTYKNLTVSANVFYHEDYKWDAFPKVAYSYKFDPFYLDVSFTATKKYPSFFRKYFSTGTTRANPDLKPQTNYCATLKLGGDHRSEKHRFSWQVAPFFNKAYDKFYTHTYFETDDDGNIVTNPETGKNIVDYTQYENLKESYWTGGDLILGYDYNRRMGVDARFTYEYTRDEVHDSSFTYIAPYKFKGRCYIKPVDKLYLQLWGTYYSDKYADQEETYKILWYYYLDFKASYAFKKSMDFFLEVKNLTDFDYYVYRGYPGNCRRIWVGIELTL